MALFDTLMNENSEDEGLQEGFRRCGAKRRESPLWTRGELMLEALDAEMAAAATDYVRLQALGEEKAALEEELSGLYARWEELSAALEAAGGGV